MPMFLREFHKILIGERGADAVQLYSGLSHAGVPVITGFLVHDNEITTVFGKKSTNGLEADLERAKKAASFPENWICQDYTIFDSPLQQEEAAQVRGMLLDNPSEKDALQGILMIIEGIDRSEPTNTSEVGSDLRE